MIFGSAILATALLLSMVAAYYSVAGLVAIFSAATIPVIIMGGSLELGKIAATVWLHNNWKRAGWAFKFYLVPAVAFLMILTSMGIFGYLSKAHSDQSLVSGDVQSKIAIYDVKIRIAKDNIDANRKALKQMDEAVDQVMGRSSDEKGADKAVAIRRAQQKERARLQSEIAAEQKTIAAVSEERAPIAAEVRKVEAEVGPIKYIAALLYGDNPDTNLLERAVRWMIIMIVLVFDPLALCLILAANKQFEWARQGTGGFVHDEPKYEPDDGPLTQKQVDQIQQSVTAFQTDQLDDPIPCYKCSTPLVDAPGIGLFCPNRKCDVMDNVKGEDPIELSISTQEISSIEQPSDHVELPDDYWDHEAENQIKAAITKWKADNPHDTLKNQRFKLIRGEISQLPWMGLLADNESRKEINSGFGTQFPSHAERGDTFVRVDRLPTMVYKYNGKDWIEVDKNLTDSYTYDIAYIDHLIERIASGEYDAELLSEIEREQVSQRLQSNTNTNT
jgi:hypothetical protein